MIRKRQIIVVRAEKPASHIPIKDHELNEITGLVEEYQQTLVEAWHDYFDP